MKIYVGCYGEEVLTAVQKRRNEILVAENNSEEVHNIVKILEEIHFIMRKRIVYNLLN